MSQRSAVQMDDDEIARYLSEPRSLNIGTIGPDGAINLVAMWFVMRDGCPVFSTYGKSQKVLNLRRDPRLSGLVESGDRYDQLRGVELIGTARILDDPAEVLDVTRELATKYGTGATEEQNVKAASKRVGIMLVPDRVISWDHAKLAPPA